MRKRMFAAAGAAAAVGFGFGVGPAHAITMVVGGLAGACYQAVRADRFDSDALDVCSRALAGEPLDAHDLAGTHVNRGAIEMRTGDYSAAHADFQAARKAMPGLGEAYVADGAYYVSQQRYADAEPLLSKGISLGIEEPEKGYYFRGVARWGLDDYKGAYFDFKKASELKPNWSLPRQQMANFHVEEPTR
jgi:tetratricopeptide (TPR) repeat protein